MPCERILRLGVLLALVAVPAVVSLVERPARAADPTAEPISLGGRRELFVDRFLIDKLDGVKLELARPRDEGAVLKFDKPWEGLFCGYCTVIRLDESLQPGGGYRCYYRGMPEAKADGSARESTCVAESADGLVWTKPELGLYDVDGTTKNNVVLTGVAPVTHNFSPFLDTKPGVPAEERWKGIGGTQTSGLVPFVSADGFRWKRRQDAPILEKKNIPFPYMFDSQNLAFWSEHEKKYVCFFRVFQDGIRRIARCDSPDFVAWSAPVLMGHRTDGKDSPVEHLYTNQTHPYFRAPHLYVSVAARFFPGRQVLTDAEAKALNVNAGYFKDTSDAILQTTRGGSTYDRTFLEGFIRPGLGAQNWVSRTNYPALNIVQTGPAEMSVYVNQDYAQPTSHLRRYSLRLDGLASARAEYEGGELLTKPLTFTGKKLLLNFATSAAGGVRVEIQDEAGKPYPGFALADAVETIGNEIEKAARWKDGDDVSALADKPVRLRFVMKDADLYALRFAE